MTKETHQILMKIAKRASEMDLLAFDRISLKMDLELAEKTFNLRLSELLIADDMNFSHDIVGIQNNINRETKEFENFFLPRYSSN